MTTTETPTPTWEEVQTAVKTLAPVRPHGRSPWARPGGHDIVTDEAHWVRLEWNPPHYFPHLGRDDRPEVNAKPTWDEIIAHVVAARKRIIVADTLVAAAAACEARVVAAYGAYDLQDELLMRVSGEHSPAADTERARLVARYQSIKEWLYPVSHAGVSYRNARDHVPDATGPGQATLEAFDPADAAVWGSTWTPPEEIPEPPAPVAPPPPEPEPDPPAPPPELPPGHGPDGDGPI